MSRARTANTPDFTDPNWAWQPYQPSEAAPWNTRRAAHLLRRAGFGGTWSEIQTAVAAGPEATLERLFAGGPDTAAFDAEARSTIASLIAVGGKQDLPAWWLFVMLHGGHPLREKLTLFWHGHFATSAAKVTDQQLMLEQNELLRKHALGNFRELVGAMGRDTAMLLWLDSSVNRKGRPNENFAREVMELFCLGTGHYTERDVKEAARCFTGWEVHNNRFWYNAAQHDAGVKQVLGARGNFDGDEVIDVLLEQPAAARFVVRKLFRFFVADEEPSDAAPAGTPNSTAARPSDEFIEPLAARFRASGYDVADVLRTMLSSNYFYSEAALGRRIKSPIEFAVGLIRGLEGKTDHYALAADLAALGQQVFYPPTVKGWNGGREWITTYSLLSRTNLVAALVGGGGRYGRTLGLDRSPALADVSDAGELVERLTALLLGVDVPAAVRKSLEKIAVRQAGEDEYARRGRVVHALASLPEFQLA